MDLIDISNYLSSAIDYIFNYLSPIIGAFFLVIVFAWHKWDKKTEHQRLSVKNDDLLPQFTKAVAKVALLMLAIFLLLLPVSEMLVSEKKHLGDGIQAFNGFSAVVFGLAIAAAGAWVSIKLAHVATEIAANQYYSEESKKRYDEAKETADMIRHLDLIITKLLVSVKHYSANLSREDPERIRINSDYYYTILEELSDTALDYAVLYQKGLQTPAFLEAVHAELYVAEQLSNKPLTSETESLTINEEGGSRLEYLIPGFLKAFFKSAARESKDDPCGVVTLLQEKDVVFLKNHFLRLKECFNVRIIHTNRDDASRGRDSVFTSLKIFAETVQEKAIAVKRASKNKRIDLEALSNAFSEVEKYAENKFQDGSSTLLKQQRNDFIAFYILDYLFTQGATYDGVENMGYGGIEKSEGINRDLSNFGMLERDDSGTTATSKPVNTREGEKGGKSFDLDKLSYASSIGRKKDRSSEEKFNVTGAGHPKTYFSKNTSSCAVLTDKEDRSKSGNSSFRSFAQVSTGNNELDQGHLRRKKGKISASALHFASATYIVPRLPRELLSLQHRDNDYPQHNAARRFDLISKLYACKQGIHILRTERVGAPENSETNSRAMELQFYVFRTLATSNGVGARLISPFLEPNGNNQLESNSSIYLDSFFRD